MSKQKNDSLQPEKKGSIFKDPEAIEFDLLADTALLDKYKSYSPCLPGYTPDSDEDKNGRLFYVILPD